MRIYIAIGDASLIKIGVQSTLYGIYEINGYKTIPVIQEIKFQYEEPGLR